MVWSVLDGHDHAHVVMILNYSCRGLPTNINSTISHTAKGRISDVPKLDPKFDLKLTLPAILTISGLVSGQVSLIT